jgi:hypothetical protein
MLPSRSVRADLAVLIAAAISLTCGGETSGPDPNAVARVVISPDSGAIDTGDSLPFTAAARNASGADLSGKTIVWSTLDATLVGVTGSGMVHGHWPGTARVVATSEGKADTAQVRVKAKITSITVTPGLDTLHSLRATMNLVVQASIDTQSYTGGSYTWQIVDTTVAAVSGLSPDATHAGIIARANGTTFVQVVEARGARDSARIVVHQRPKTIIVVPPQLRGYRACPFPVTVFVVDSLGSPVANVRVTWSSMDTTLARIDSSGLVTPLAPGLDTIVVQAAPVSRSAPLTIGIAPSVTLQTLGAASPVTTVGRGQFALGIGSLGGGSSDAPARFSIVSSDTTVVAVPSDTSVSAGQSSFGPLRLVGRKIGTVTLTPYLCDVPGSSVGFTVTRPVLGLSGAPATTARTDDPPASLAVLTRDTTGALQYVADPVTVQITSTNATVLAPDSVYYHVPAAHFRADFGFTYPDSGSARLIITDSAGLYLSDSTPVVHVLYPPIYFSDYLNSAFGDTVRMGMRQRAYPPNQRPQVVLDRLVVGAPLSIHLSMSDSTIAHITPDSVAIPVGGSGAPIDIAGGDARDTATLTAHATRHLDGHLIVIVDRPKVTIGTFNGGAFPGESIFVQVAAWDSATFAPGYPTEDVTFNLSASDPSVVSTGSTTVTIHAGTAASATIGLLAKGPGTTTITAYDPRVAAYAYAPGTTTPITVVAPSVSTDSTISLGIQQNWNLNVVENGPHPGGNVVHVQQRNPAVLLLSDTVLTIGVGGNYASLMLTSTASGVDTLIFSAAGYAPDTSIATVGLGKILLGSWPSTSMAVGDSVPVYFYIGAPDGTQRVTADTVTFTLAPNANIEFHQDGAVITTVTIPAGDQYTQPFFYMKAKAAGTGSVTISAPNYTPLTQSVTIAP